MKPIQDEIYNAVKKIAEERNYMMIIDRASSGNIILRHLKPILATRSSQSWDIPNK